MKISRLRKPVGTTLGIALLAACSGTGTGVPAASSASLGAQHRIDGAASSRLSGDYVGKFTDGAYGAGKATASYSQSQSSVGGILTVKYAKSTVALSVALVAQGSSVNGTTVAGTGSLYCTFSTTSTYDSKTHVMSGSYSAVYGCTGDGGTFTLKQKCYYKGANETVLPANGPKPC
ncbi:MAG: hypothetical protein JO146_00350 [Candidatus Eremiobacteraeota bacterium]|nr:hypothetical protein [Candidatus Eremiobacteraeota bacterium]